MRHVLEMASASVAADNKTLELDIHVSEDVPLEVGTCSQHDLINMFGC